MEEKIMALKNDKERIAFLEDFRNTENGWRLWKDMKSIGRRWWRLDLARGFTKLALIVEEEIQTIHYPAEGEEWITRCWFIRNQFSGLAPFADSRGSRTQALTALKDWQKIQKEFEE